MAVSDPTVDTNLLVPATTPTGSPRAASAGSVKMPPPPAMASMSPATKATRVQRATPTALGSGTGPVHPHPPTRPVPPPVNRRGRQAHSRDVSGCGGTSHSWARPPRWYTLNALAPAVKGPPYMNWLHVWASPANRRAVTWTGCALGCAPPA